MDKNQAIGLLLSALLLIVYFQYFAPSPVPGIEEGAPEATEAPARQSKLTPADQPPAQQLPDSAQQSLNEQRYGAFGSVMTGKAQDITLENNNVVITLSSRGGSLNRVVLRKYNAYKNGSVILLNEESSVIDRLVETRQGVINLNDLYFSANPTTGEDSSQVELTATLADGNRVRQIYTLGSDSYQLGYQLTITNSSQLLAEQTLDFAWKDDLQVVEKDPEESRRRSQINYYTAAGDLESLSSLTGEGDEEETVTEPIKWISMKQRFFSSAIIAEQAFGGAQLSSLNPVEGSGIVKRMAMNVTMPLNNGSAGVRLLLRSQRPAGDGRRGPGLRGEHRFWLVRLWCYQ